MDYIVTKETKNGYLDDVNSLKFSDNYFEMTINYPPQEYHRVFIDPKNRKYYIKTYPRDIRRERKAIEPKSFMQFESIKEKISEFRAFNY